jgi:hypothetical protein
MNRKRSVQLAIVLAVVGVFICLSGLYQIIFS